MFGEPFKNISINIDGLDERSLISSGSLITGSVSFTLKKETTVSSITLQVGGVAHVHWTTGGKHKRHFADKQEIFVVKDVILRSDEDPNGTVKLRPGTHVFPFTCQIPAGDFPSSLSQRQAHIKYSAVVRVFRPWHMSKEHERVLNLVSYFNTNQPELWRPLEGSNEKHLCCLCCTSGPIRLTARAERRVFRPGEIVKVLCDISNCSSGTFTPVVKLRQRQALHAYNGTQNLTLFKVLSSAFGDLILGHTSLVQMEILLTIPLTAPLTISNCSLVELVYNLEVSLRRMGSYSLKVLIPIILYGIP